MDRFLYPIGYVPYKIVSRCFRPLARWIGSYTSTGDFLTGKRVMFPSPREVDRFLYQLIREGNLPVETFPSPLEVDRFLYRSIPGFEESDSPTQFPSPLEVDRFLYLTKNTKIPS